MTVVTQGLTGYPQDPQLLAKFNALHQMGVKPALKRLEARLKISQ